MTPLNHTLLLDCISEVKEGSEQDETEYLRDKCRRLQERIEYLEMQLLVGRIDSLERGLRLVRHGGESF